MDKKPIPANGTQPDHFDSNGYSKNEGILIVDDEINILEGLKCSLRKRFTIETACSGAEALELMRHREPFAVVVSDLHMPGMNGIELLERIHVLSCDTVRIMLTGQADLEAAMAAVNQGHIFRFLIKPCPLETLITAIEAALGQHRLVVAERELLDQTLRGSIQLLAELLAIASPEAFGRSVRLQRLVRRLIQAAKPRDSWEIDLAAALSLIGYIFIPKDVTQKKLRGDRLTTREEGILASVPMLGARYISRIPRLENVGEIIRRQNDPFNAKPRPALGSRILKLASDYDLLMLRGIKKFEALVALRARVGCYDLNLLKLLEEEVYREEGFTRRVISVADLTEGMIVEENIFIENGLLILAKGQEINATVLLHLESFARSYGTSLCEVAGPVPVMVPLSKDSSKPRL